MDLEVKDWKPSMARVPVVQIQDPIKYPRFPAEAKVDSAVPVSVAPNSEYFENREKNLVNMSKMIGREDSVKMIEETNLVVEEIEGKIGANHRAELAAQKSLAIAKGIDFTTKHKYISENIIDFSRQIGRPDLDDSGKDEVEIQRLPITAGHIQEQLMPRLVSHTDWSKMTGRDDSIVTTHPDIGAAEELILNPSTSKTSRYCSVCFQFYSIHCDNFI